MIKVLKSYSSPKAHSVKLEVLQNPEKITVNAGTFRVSGTQYHLDQNLEWAMSPQAQACEVTGFLALHEEAGTVLVVDEVLPGELAYNFDNSPYKLLHRLFRCLVPAAADDLDGVPVSVFHIVEPANQKQEQA